MQVYLVSEPEEYGKAIQTLLRERNIEADVVGPGGVEEAAHCFVVFLSIGSDPSTCEAITRLTSRNNTVIAVAKPATVFPEMEGVYLLPADIRNDILAGLISCFQASRDREAHYSWITDELTKVNRSLQDETMRLKAARDELDLKNKKITEELALAGVIQNSLLPRHFPADVPLNFSHKYIPHEYIGGDFFDILQVDERHLGILIADVSGHGVSSALITTMLKSVFLHDARGCLSPARVLKKLNVEFTQAIRTEHYITAFYSIIDTERLTMKFANAGHPRQILVRGNGDAELIGANGFFLGMFEPTEYEERSVDLQPGDRLINYTDGIIECPDETGAHFGQENLLRVITRHAGDDIEYLSKRIIIDLIAYMAEARFPDDITLLISEVIPFL
jgi:serine phosphatase RsbU (regulator of sigma subunit)